MRRALLAALVLLAAGVACQSPEERVAEHRARAEAYAEEGKANEAILELRSALKVDPKNAETCLQLARLYEARGDLQQAYFFFTEAARLDPDDVGAKLQVARLLLGDDPDEAQRIAEEVLEAHPDNASAWIRLSEVHLVKADSDEALRAALTATEIAPDNASVFHQLGRVHQARYREARLLSRDREAEAQEHRALLEEALAAFERAAGLYAKTGGGALNEVERARVLGLLGRPEEAEAAYRHALERAESPRHKQEVLGHVLRYARRRSPELARWALEERVRLQPSAISAWVELARNAEGEQPEAGLEALKRMIEALPGSATARITYARYLAEHGRNEGAIAFLAASESDPDVNDDPGLTLDRGLLLLQQRNVDGARRAAEQLRREAPDSPERALLDARIALHEKRTRDAIDILTTSLEVAGDRLATRRLLAQAYQAGGDRSRALAQVEEVLAQAPRDPDMLSLRGRIQLAQGLPADAIRSFRRVQQARPMTRSERVMLARAHYRDGHPERGAAILDAMLSRAHVPLAAVALAENEMDRSPERARSVLEEALENGAGAQRDEVLELLTVLDLQQSKGRAALERINRHLEEGAVTPELVLLRAKVLLAMSQVDAAERDLLRLYQHAPSNAEVIDLLVRVYVSQGRTQEAIASFEQASEAGDMPAETSALLARLYWAEGDLERARDLLAQAIEKRSDLPLAKNDLAYLLAERGEDLERALVLAQEARSALPGDPNTADTLGWVYLKRGLAEPALDQFREAIGTATGRDRRAIFHHHLGLALRELGRTDEARDAFETALATDPDFSKSAEAREALDALDGAEATQG